MGKKKTKSIVKSYRLEATIDEDGMIRVNRENYRMTAFEIIGILEQSKNDIYRQLNEDGAFDRYYFDTKGNKVRVEERVEEDE